MSVLRRLGTFAINPFLQSQDSDRYKLGLFILRCLAPGRGSSTNRDPGAADRVLDGRGRFLMHTAITAPPADRPTAREWLLYLGSRTGQPWLSPVPVVARRTLPPSTGWRRTAHGAWVAA